MEKGNVCAHMCTGEGENVQKNTLICTKDEREVLKCKYVSVTEARV